MAFPLRAARRVAAVGFWYVFSRTALRTRSYISGEGEQKEQQGEAAHHLHSLPIRPGDLRDLVQRRPGAFQREHPCRATGKPTGRLPRLLCRRHHPAEARRPRRPPRATAEYLALQSRDVQFEANPTAVCAGEFRGKVHFARRWGLLSPLPRRLNAPRGCGQRRAIGVTETKCVDIVPLRVRPTFPLNLSIPV